MLTYFYKYILLFFFSKRKWVSGLADRVASYHLGQAYMQKHLFIWNSNLNEDSVVLLSASAFSPLRCVAVEILVDGGNLLSQIGGWERDRISIAFSNNCRHSLFDITPKLKKWYFLKTGKNVGSETTPMNLCTLLHDNLLLYLILWMDSFPSPHFEKF